MRIKLISAALVCLFVTSVNIAAQEAKKPLTNSDVVDMMKAGLPETTVILAIQKGPTNFDTSPLALVQMKNQGVSGRVLDAMIQAGTEPPVSTPSNQANPNDPLGSGNNATLSAAGGVFLIDGSQRTSMRYSTPEARSNSMLGAVVNPFHKSRIRAAFNGNHAQLRTKNTSPIFEVSLAADINPSDVVAVVKLKPKSDTREIETVRGGITGVSTGFRKEDRVSITLEEINGSASPNQKLYRIKLVNPIAPGEYALVYRGAMYYDFGVDAN